MESEKLARAVELFRSEFTPDELKKVVAALSLGKKPRGSIIGERRCARLDDPIPCRVTEPFEMDAPVTRTSPGLEADDPVEVRKDGVLLGSHRSHSEFLRVTRIDPKLYQQGAQCIRLRDNASLSIVCKWNFTYDDSSIQWTNARSPNHGH